MNRSKQFIPVLAASLSLLALPVFGQGTGSGSGSGTGGAGSGTSDRPTSSGAGSSTSGSGLGSADSTTPGSTSGSYNSGQLSAQGSVNFDQIDADSDGRVSLSEYTQSQLAAGGVGSGSTSTTARSGGVSGTTQGAINPSESFSKLDRNNDGYLSKEELKAAKHYEGSNSGMVDDTTTGRDRN